MLVRCREKETLIHCWWWVRLGPETLCCWAGTWTNISSSKIQRNYMGLKIAVCMPSWGKLWTTRYKKTKKPNCHLWTARNKSRVWSMPPPNTTPQRKQPGPMLLVFAPRSPPKKPCLNFLSGLLSISLDKGKPRTLGSNSRNLYWCRHYGKRYGGSSEN